MVTFPPLPPKHRRRRQVDTGSGNDSDDPDDPQDVLSVSPPLRKSKSMRSPTDSSTKVSLETTLTRKKSSPERRRSSRREDNDPEDKWLSMRGLIKGASPYVLLDGTLTTAYSPSAFASRAATSDFLISGQSFIPRAKSASLSFDLRTLSIHLALRATEILACAEAMWDWVTEYQKRIQSLGTETKASVDSRKSTTTDDSTSVDAETKN